MKTRFKFLFILIPLLFVALGSVVLMALWNWLMPVLFGLGTLTYLQALGILVLIRILTWGGGWFGLSRWRRFAYAPAGNYYCPTPYYHRHESWRMRMKEQWEKMTPEEREKWNNRCGKNFWNDPSIKEEPVKA